ncbi:hypothetical protein AURDEDRAFT_172199 [Auricularia subglabra TFB-10046 SS5]|nr:hypothetical protein AURDEDRAFT_172199 [Auricularia subglabra TFB-10046 SS5]
MTWQYVVRAPQCFPLDTVQDILRACNSSANAYASGISSVGQTCPADHISLSLPGLLAYPLGDPFPPTATGTSDPCGFWTFEFGDTSRVSATSESTTVTPLKAVQDLEKSAVPASLPANAALFPDAKVVANDLRLDLGPRARTPSVDALGLPTPRSPPESSFWDADAPSQDVVRRIQAGVRVRKADLLPSSSEAGPSRKRALGNDDDADDDKPTSVPKRPRYSPIPPSFLDSFPRGKASPSAFTAPDSDVPFVPSPPSYGREPDDEYDPRGCSSRGKKQRAQRSKQGGRAVRPARRLEFPPASVPPLCTSVPSPSASSEVPASRDHGDCGSDPHRALASLDPEVPKRKRPAPDLARQIDRPLLPPPVSPISRKRLRGDAVDDDWASSDACTPRPKKVKRTHRLQDTPAPSRSRGKAKNSKKPTHTHSRSAGRIRCPNPGCTKTFSRDHECNRHVGSGKCRYYPGVLVLEKYTDETQRTCGYCGKVFSRRDAWQRHDKNVSCQAHREFLKAADAAAVGAESAAASEPADASPKPEDDGMETDNSDDSDH